MTGECPNGVHLLQSTYRLYFTALQMLSPAIARKGSTTAGTDKQQSSFFSPKIKSIISVSYPHQKIDERFVFFAELIADRCELFFQCWRNEFEVVLFDHLNTGPGLLCNRHRVNAVYL